MSTFDDALEGVPSLPVIADRQRGLARSVGDLLKWRNGRDGMDAWRTLTDDQLHTMREDMKQIKLLLWGLIFTCLAGFVSVAVAVYFSTQGAHP